MKEIIPKNTVVIRADSPRVQNVEEAVGCETDCFVPE